ncbi:nuclear transport factor 2 family protein [Cyanobacteria bacterium FACHB-472]|nr:nuclear transport factor 2 family protein [Cyanobacteria bacterium FACHB-472]
MDISFVAVPVLMLLAGYPQVGLNNTELQKQQTKVPLYEELNIQKIKKLPEKAFFKQQLLAETKQNQSDRQAIRELVNKQFKALNEKNLLAYMDTVDKESTGYEFTKELLIEIYKTYELKYELNSLEFVSISANEARVRMIQTTTKLKGPEFRNNKLTSINILKKRNGQWRMDSTETEKIEYLN